MASFLHAKQVIESKATSLNQVAATFKRVAFERGTINLDYGGGRYDKAAEALGAQGCENVVYDPFNRSPAHNFMARLRVARSGLAHTATVNNVLNVIAEPEALAEAVEQAANGIKDSGTAYFLIHEGDRSGVGKPTSKGWQRNQKTQDYLEAISRSFGRVERKGNLIAAGEPRRSPRSLFVESQIQDEILAAAKSAGVPMPSPKLGAGKLIGGCLYLHRSCWGELPSEALERALACAPPDLEPCIAKWEPKTGCLSLIESRGFDEEHEPAIERAAKVHPDGKVSITPAKADPQIYHHKWNFVRPGYAGFDYFASVARSLEWAGIACDRSRIGTLSYWRERVLPALSQAPSNSTAGPKPPSRGPAP